MTNQIQAFEKPKILPRTASKKPKREKLIRVTDETYLKLSKLGDLTEDYEDVVAKLLRFWEEHHKER
jgi:hypothetical protein